MVPENQIQEFVRRAREAGGANIESIILFGSAASGDFQPGLSDVNVFCVLRDNSLPALQALAPAVQWWQRQSQPPPQCMTRRELERSTDVFTIELLDMVQHHKVLFGDDVLQGLQIPMRLHRVQVEYELREKLMLLRQHLLLAGDSTSRLWEVMLHSVPSFATLFRHAVMVFGGTSLPGRREAILALQNVLQFDFSAVMQVLDVRERKLDKKKLEVQDLCSSYVAAIETLTTAVDKALDSQATGPQ